MESFIGENDSHHKLIKERKSFFSYVITYEADHISVYVDGHKVLIERWYTKCELKLLPCCMINIRTCLFFMTSSLRDILLHAVKYISLAFTYIYLQLPHGTKIIVFVTPSIPVVNRRK